VKIFQFIQKPQLRGAEIFATQLSNHLRSTGCDVDIIALFNGPGKLPFNGEPVVLGANSRFRFFDPLTWWRINRLIRKARPDIVQANAGDTLKYLVFSKLIFRWKSPIVYRNANMMGNFVNTRFKYWFNRFLIRRVDFVISVSEQCRQDLLKTFQISADKTITIPIGIDIKSAPSVADTFPEFHDRTPILVSVASLVPEKNHLALLRIFSKVKTVSPNSQLLIIGDGPLEGVISNSIQQLGLSSSVKMLGSRNDVLGIVKKSDLFVLPSLIEGLPGVILEAMYCKTMVVANDVGGISEVISHGKTGWLVDPGEEDRFSDTVVASLKLNALERDRIIDSAFATVIRNFDNAIVSERFLETYKDVSRND
jgi:glycosyltransferase involved in cell wall biosynthesis